MGGGISRENMALVRIIDFVCEYRWIDFDQYLRLLFEGQGLF